MHAPEYCDVLIIGAGQAGLATAYHLRRFALKVVLLDAEAMPGGSWLHAWDSLRLFSPAEISSLPGWPLSGVDKRYPAPTDLIRYFAAYEDRYGFDVRRPVRVVRVSGDGPFRTETADGASFEARFIVNASGNASRPFVPFVPGRDTFAGQQLHSRQYRTPTDFAGLRVAVVGGGNSGAQIAADLTDQAEVTWCTLRPPRYLPDDYDGAALFRLATQHSADPSAPAVSDIGDIVAVPAVRTARDSGKLQATPMFSRLLPSGAQWSDGSVRPLDSIIWCTGFRPALSYLPKKLHAHPRVHFVGYGDWVGPAADTIIGAGRIAKSVAQEILATS